MDENDYYFDNDFLYEHISGKKHLKIPLEHISHILKTAFEVNNQSVWQILFEYNGEKRQFKFLPSKAIYKNNFIEFKKMIKDNYPNVKQSYFTLVEWKWEK